MGIFSWRFSFRRNGAPQGYAPATDVEIRVYRVLAITYSGDGAKTPHLKPDTNLRKSGFEEYHFGDLVLNLAAEFDLRLEDWDVRNLNTPREIYEMIERKRNRYPGATL